MAPMGPTFTPQAIPEVIRVEPRVHRDHRGFFVETHNERTYAQGGIDVRFVQDNASSSVRGTLRGLHAQVRRPQAKLVRAVYGEIFDVAVDIRRESPTFGQWVGVTLSGDNFHQLYIPAGFAHGFCVLSHSAVVAYKVSDFYDPEGEITISHRDPALGIQWPIHSPVLSDRDSDALTLRELVDSLPQR